MATALTKRDNGSLAQQQNNQEVYVRAEEPQRPWSSAPVDVYESRDDYLVFADVPGVELENIKVEYDDRQLRIEACRIIQDYQAWNTDFRRVFTLGSDVDVARIEAELKDGILTVRLPKLEAAKPKQITIRGAS